MSVGNILGGIVGGVGGFFVGGPVGAAVGAAAGSAVGGGVEKVFSKEDSGQIGGAVAGGVAGFALGGPLGAVAGGFLGNAIGGKIGAHNEEQAAMQMGNQMMPSQMMPGQMGGCYPSQMGGVGQMGGFSTSSGLGFDMGNNNNNLPSVPNGGMYGGGYNNYNNYNGFSDTQMNSMLQNSYASYFEKHGAQMPNIMAMLGGSDGATNFALNQSQDMMQQYRNVSTNY